MLGIQDKIYRALSFTQRKFMDTMIETLGTKCRTILLEITEDDYHDETIELIENKEIIAFINFPGNEVPLPDSGNTNTTSTNTIHMYDILPITANFKFSDSVKKGNVILYKIKIGEGVYSVTPFQLLEPIGQATVSDVTFISWNIAPITNWQLGDSTEYQTIVNLFKNSDNWDEE